MKRFLTAAAAIAFAAAPALAQTGGTGATTVPPVVPDAQTGATTGPTGATGTTSQDNMGAAATTGDTTAPTGGMTMGTDSMSTSSTEAEQAPGSIVPTEGMDPSGAATASESTPSSGIVPGQSSN